MTRVPSLNWARGCPWQPEWEPETKRKKKIVVIVYGIAFAGFHGIFAATNLFFIQFGVLVLYCVRKVLVYRKECASELARGMVRHKA